MHEWATLVDVRDGIECLLHTREGLSCRLKVDIVMAYPVIISFPERHGGALDNERSIDDGNKGGCPI